MFKSSPAKKLKRVLGDFELPSFPAVVMRVLEQIRDPDSSVDTVSSCVELDPGLSVRMLATVNSAAYAPHSRVENLNQAIAMLGMSAVESIVLAVAVSDVLPRPSCPGFDRTRFWQAAARRATVAQSLACVLHPATRSEAFTAALLQDMAVPLLAASRTKDYGPVLECWHEADDELHVLEHDALGIDHAEVATLLCDSWQLPASLSAAIGDHHNGDATESSCPPAVRIVSCLREGTDESETDAVVALASDEYGMASDDVLGILESGEAEATELATLFC